jgi:hypothetical protein
MGGISQPLGGARTTRGRLRVGHPLIFSGGVQPPPHYEAEHTPFSRVTGSDRCVELTSTARCGEDRGNPDMPLQSTSTLGSSPLHAEGSDRSSLEETLVSLPYGA